MGKWKTDDYSAEYPDEIAWSRDNNYVKVQGAAGSLSGAVTVAQGGRADLKPGGMLFFDKLLQMYRVVDREEVADFLSNLDTERYTTNYDTYIGTFDGVAHFCAKKDATTGSPLFADNVAATPCYYRIEIDNSLAGYITFSANSGNASIPSTTIEWEAGDAMATIVAKFTALNRSYITFGALADGRGVGLNIGGYESNTMTVTDKTFTCEVIDCSALAFYFSENPGLAVGDDYDPSEPHIPIGAGAHHNWRGSTAASILTGMGLVGASTECIGNTGQNYSYRTGLNFGKFKISVVTGGNSTFYADGVNGSTNSSAGYAMRKTVFDANVNQEAAEGSNQAKMYEYYYHLLNDEAGEYAELRATYEARYGTLADLYDCYLASHCIDVNAGSGIAYLMRNMGDHQTTVKADVANVTCDYKIVPAYPPEWNAKQYGGDEGFEEGKYYHPEPGDLGLFLRDDIMPLVNANIALAEGGLALDISTDRGSSADFNSNYSCFFYGASGSGCFGSNRRYNTTFLCRPSIALTIDKILLISRTLPFSTAGVLMIVRLDSLLRTFPKNVALSIALSVGDEVLTAPLRVLDGITLHGRRHGSQRHYYSKTGEAWELYLPTASEVEVLDNLFDELQRPAGLATFGAMNGLLQVTPAEPVRLGEVWNEETYGEGAPYLVEVETIGEGCGVFPLYYRNSDGAECLVPARALEVETEGGAIDYDRAESVVRGIPLYLATGAGQTLQVALNDIPKAQHIEDLAMTSEAWLVASDGAKIPVKVGTTQIVRGSDEREDYIVELILQRR